MVELSGYSIVGWQYNSTTCRVFVENSLKMATELVVV